MEATTTTKTDTVNLCKKHNTALLTCSFEGCTKTDICRYCSMESKEEIQHLADHFDSLKDIKSELGSEFKSKVKEDEMYGDLNTAYRGFIDRSNEILDSVFNQLLEKKLQMSEQVATSLNTKYDEITVQFETLVKQLSEKLNTMSTTDNKAKDEFRKIKKDLDDKLNFLTNPSIFSKDFVDFLEKFEKKLKALKIEDALNGKFNFTYKMSNCDLNFEHGSPNILVTPRGSSYWCYRSKEFVEGPFTCKVLVKSINPSHISTWQYCFGLIRPTMNSESSYYNDSTIFMCDGYCNTQYSGSGGKRLWTDRNWKAGDELLMKRDEQNNVWFGINSETTMQLVYTSIFGQMRIVMGFGASVNGGEFEMIELIKN